MSDFREFLITYLFGDIETEKCDNTTRKDMREIVRKALETRLENLDNDIEELCDRLYKTGDPWKELPYIISTELKRDIMLKVNEISSLHE